MKALQQWFNQLKRREQLTVLVGGACVLFYLLGVFVWRPLVSDKLSLAQQNSAAEQSLQRVQQLAGEYRQLLQSGAQDKLGAGQSLPQLIDSTAVAQQLTIGRFQPSASGDVQLRLDNAPFNNVLAWLYQLEHNYAIAVRDLAINPGSGEGLVNVTVRLHQGA